MVYCRNCGEEVSDSAIYCPSCGNSLNQAEDTETGLDKFWNTIDGLVDSQVDGLKDRDISVPPYLEDKLVFGLRMYIMGNVKVWSPPLFC
ncbi:zinc ribbon domain-containing protein [Natrialbaceae archaeon A-chndr2]